jgi:hypothetical protein
VTTELPPWQRQSRGVPRQKMNLLPVLFFHDKHLDIIHVLTQFHVLDSHWTRSQLLSSLLY